MPDDRKIILLLGGARSGKSTFAQKLASQLGTKVLFVATGEPLDDEMQARIEEHQKNRPKHWRTLESPRHIGKVLGKQINNAEVVLIDCITLLVANLLRDETDYPEVEKHVTKEINGLIAVIETARSSFIIVSNEVGLGLVPDNKLGRIYRDILGKVNQVIAQHANEVYLMTAGIPLKIK